MQRRLTFRGRVARWWLARRHATIVHLIFPEARRDLELVARTRRQVPLLVEDAAALEILAHVRAARRPGLAMAEAGVFAGGTARLICEAKGDAPLYLFDVFDAAPHSPGHETAAELASRFSKLHVPRRDVEAALAGCAGVHFRPGLFPESARGLEDLRFSFVHLDLDLESSTRAGLEFFYPRLCRGGILIGDDYNLASVRRPFDAFFAGRGDPVVALPWGQVIVVRTE